MQQFKGVKGEWYEDKNTTFGGKNSIIVSKKQGVIVGFTEGDFCSYEEMEATARLMAAAPDLLEALQNCLDDNKECSEIMQSTINKAKKAIEKALK